MTDLSDFDDYINDEDYLETVQDITRGDGPIKALLYVEGSYDIFYWNRVLEIIGFSDCFETSIYGRYTGRAKLLELLEEGKLNKSQMIAIDADLDRLVGFKVDKFDSPFVFDTYVYSIEGVILHADVIEKLINQIKHDYSYLDLDFGKFISQYSYLCYMELSKIVKHFLDKSEDSAPSDLEVHFNSCDLTSPAIANFLLDHNKHIFDVPPQGEECVCEILLEKCVFPEDAYLYVRGHSLMHVIEKLIAEIKKTIRVREFERIRSNCLPQQIDSEQKKYNNLIHSMYVLDTYLRFAEYPQHSPAMKHLKQKINKTVDKYGLH